jgi:hypothetical protein
MQLEVQVGNGRPSVDDHGLSHSIHLDDARQVAKIENHFLWSSNT